MPDPADSISQFFVAGGTLSAEATSYVARAADDELFGALLAGKFCYVLNSRQMGKSSLCVRTIKRLEAESVRTAFVDLTKIGGKNVTPDQWYAGIGVEIGRSLGMRTEILDYWKENSHLSAVQRLFGALREVVLEGTGSRVAVFFDEIDATRSLPFNPDEFFAAIRESYNRRVQDDSFSRLTFCLLGVALPSDLINSPTSTPFNIGERMYLRDFTLDEAMTFASGLAPARTPEQADALVKQVFHWTNGHPYLTQSLCEAVAKDRGITTSDDVDALVKRDLLELTARETNINLADVGNRALHAGDVGADPEKFRADLLSAYDRALRGKPIPDDESNRVVAVLKLSGLMRSEGNVLRIRNRIYQSVFDRRWVRDNMPGQELRRQKRSYWLGALRTAIVGALVIAIVSSLAVRLRLAAVAYHDLFDVAERHRLEAQIAEKKAEYQAYVADLAAMRTADSDRNYIELARLLGETRDSQFRGIEWQYWNSQIHNAPTEIAYPADNGSIDLAPDGKSAALMDSAKLAGGIFTYPDLRRLGDIPKVSARSDFGFLFGHWVSVAVKNLHEFQLTDAVSGDPLGVVSLKNGVIFHEFGAPDRSALGLALGLKLENGVEHGLDMISVWLPSPLRRAFDYPVTGGVFYGAVSGGGRFALIALRPPHSVTYEPTSELQEFIVVDMAAKKELDRFSTVGSPCRSVSISNDGRLAAAAFLRGRAVVRDVRLHRTVFDATPFATKVSEPQISQDDRRLLIQGDETVHVYDLGSGRLICSQPGGFSSTLSLDGKTFAVVGPGCRVYNVEPTIPTTRHVSDGATIVVGVDQVGRPIVESGSVVRLVDPNTLQPVPQSESPGPILGNASWRCVPESGRIAVVSTVGSRRLCYLRDQRAMPVAMETTPDGSRIAVLDRDISSIRVFDSTGQLKWIHSGGVVVNFVWAPDGSRMIVAGFDQTLEVLDGTTGRPLRPTSGTESKIACCTFSHGGHLMAWGGDHYIHVEDLDSKKPEILLTGHSGKVNSIAFSTDDSRLLTASDDGTVRLWDPTTGAQLLRLGSGRGSAESAVFDNDTRRIFSADDAGDLTVYQLGPPIQSTR